MLEDFKEFDSVRIKRIVDYPGRSKSKEVTFIDLPYFVDFVDLIADRKCKGDVIVAVPEWMEDAGYKLHERMKADFVEVTEDDSRN
jgi:hypothetical protein